MCVAMVSVSGGSRPASPLSASAPVSRVCLGAAPLFLGFILTWRRLQQTGQSRTPKDLELRVVEKVPSEEAKRSVGLAPMGTFLPSDTVSCQRWVL